MNPGPGVGGHCIPVDPQFLSNASPFITELIQSARRVNDRMPNHIVNRIAEMAGPARGRKIALLGAAYKADVDDARESPTARIADLLHERGYATAVYDPLVNRFSEPLCESLALAATGADALVLITPHSAFRNVRPAEMASLMRTPRLIDTRNFFDVDEWQRCGFECYLLGRRLATLARQAVA